MTEEKEQSQTVSSSTFEVESGAIGIGNNNTVGGERSVIGSSAEFIVTGDYNKIIVGAEDIESLPPDDGQPPYQGLSHFQEEQAEWFFGREKLISILVNRLHQTDFLAVVGASGSGKSSVIQAGVLPVIKRAKQLQDGSVPPPGNWQVKILTPTEQPLAKLAETLFPNDFARQTEVQQRLREESTIISSYIEAQVDDAAGERLLIVVDQFEELFSLCKDEQQRQQFIVNLLAPLSPKLGKVIFSLRADFYAHCLSYELLRTYLQQDQLIVGQMRADELIEAVLAPAQKGGWQFQKGLAEQILQDVGQEPGNLPLLSHALLETWQRRRGRTLTLSGYREAGGVRGAIAQTAENVYTAATPPNKNLIRKIFLELTELGEGAQYTRRRVAKSNLLLKADAQHLAPVLRELASSHVRLITINSHQTNNGEFIESVEVAHEAVIREWPRLHEWILANRDALRLERKLHKDAEEWEAFDHNESLLYRGARLDLALELINDEGVRLSKEVQEFLAASQQLHEREIARLSRELETQQQLTRRTRTLLVIVIVIAIALAYSPARNYIYRQQARNLGESIEIAGQWVQLSHCDKGLGFLQETPDSVICEDAESGTEFFVNSFEIDKLEVTNRQYALCVEVGQCTEPNSDYLNNPADDPVGGLDALQAQRYCNWVGLKLPTEVQWELAAKNENIQNIGGEPNSVSEWTSTLSTQYTADPYDPKAIWDGDPRTIAFDSSLIIRGASYLDSESRRNPSIHLDDQSFGVRCAK